ncbi:MAG: PAS domain-containing sensor histidine kinase [Bacteroidetes bacterium]|nr:PAS domain-containing sensor histidine kinase [Bacteroidota bacterium]
MNITGEQFRFLCDLYSSVAYNCPVFLIQIFGENNNVVCSSKPENISIDQFNKLISIVTDLEIKKDGNSEYIINLDENISTERFNRIKVELVYNCEFSVFYILSGVSENIIENDVLDKLVLIKKCINERLQYEETINKQYIETTSNIHNVIYSTNVTGTHYYFISKSVENLFGLKIEDIIKNKFSLLRKVVPEYFKGYNKFIKKLKSGERSEYEYQIFEADKKIRRWIRHTGTPVIINGRVERVVGIMSDITEEKTILNKLEKSEEKFRLLIETVSDLIIVLNSFGYVSLINKNGAKSLGYKPEEILGKHFLELIEESNKNNTVDAFQKILSSEEVTDFEATLLDKFENQVVYDFQATPTKDDNVISGMLALGRDVTKRRQDENRMIELNTKLVEANRLISIERDRAKQQLTVLEEINKLKNEFVSRVSHELRTPLASIVGFAETIVSDEDMPKEMVVEFNNIILTEGKRLAKLVNDVLDFSKLESMNFQLNKKDNDLVEILYLIADSFKSYAEEKEVTMNFEIPEAEIIILADRELISKAIKGIVENAIKFNKPGGRVSLIVQDFLNEVEIMINDTGIGIPEKELPKIFEKFNKFDTKTGQTVGAGLGLAYVKQVIDVHKGLLQVKSEVNKGSTFIIRLPKKK